MSASKFTAGRVPSCRMPGAGRPIVWRLERYPGPIRGDVPRLILPLESVTWQPATTKWIKRSAHRPVRDLVASLRTWITN